MIVLSEDSKLLPHSVGGLADFRRGVILKHHHRVVLRACNCNIESIYKQPNTDRQTSQQGNVLKKPDAIRNKFYLNYLIMTLRHKNSFWQQTASVLQ